MYPIQHKYYFDIFDSPKFLKLLLKLILVIIMLSILTVLGLHKWVLPAFIQDSNVFVDITHVYV